MVLVEQFLEFGAEGRPLFLADIQIRVSVPEGTTGERVRSSGSLAHLQDHLESLDRLRRFLEGFLDLRIRHQHFVGQGQIHKLVDQHRPPIHASQALVQGLVLRGRQPPIRTRSPAMAVFILHLRSGFRRFYHGVSSAHGITTLVDFAFRPIGVVTSCFKERFGIPRQPRMVPEARAVLSLYPRPEVRKALRSLEGFSHVWIIFVFHKAGARWKPLVRPPRLGGTRKVGVFASRSPHRPNPIGISAVELERIDSAAARLHLKGVDFLDGTPVLDVKPYLPYADSIPRARTGWAGAPRPRLVVRFSSRALRVCRASGPPLRRLIAQMLRWDPRPAFQTRGSGSYAARLLDYDVHWDMKGRICTVREIRTQGLSGRS